MIRTVLALSAAAVLAVTVAPADAASGFTIAPTQPVVGVPFTLTSLQPCDLPPCRYLWRAYQTTRPDSTGFPVADTYSGSVTVTFGSPGSWSLVLTQTNRARRGGPSVTQPLVVGAVA